jgi:hypothetical protein
MKSAISEDWIKRYVDQLLEVAGKLEPGPLRDSVLLRADFAMDIVKAWRESEQKRSDN